MLVKFQGTDSRADAESLTGALYVEPSDLRRLDPGEYWEHDLLGCEVVLGDGSTVGRVVGFVPGAAQDLLTVKTAEGDRLVPMVKAIVTEVDVPNGRVVLDPPEGLLD